MQNILRVSCQLVEVLGRRSPGIAVIQKWRRMRGHAEVVCGRTAESLPFKREAVECLFLAREGIDERLFVLLFLRRQLVFTFEEYVLAGQKASGLRRRGVVERAFNHQGDRL